MYIHYSTMFTDYTSDEYLHGEYREFIANPSDAKRILLDIGIYVNEIWQRMGIMEKIFGREKESEEIGREWEELGMASVRVRNRGEFDGLQRKLDGILRRITCGIEGRQNCEENRGEMGKNEVKTVKRQLHKNKLAKIILGEQNEWEKMGEKRRKNILQMLLNRKNTKKTNLISRFEEHLDGWRKMEGQREIGDIENIEKVIFVILFV